MEIVQGITEASYKARDFRTRPDVENFYRFVCENDLRKESLLILEAVHKAISVKKKSMKKKKNG